MTEGAETRMEWYVLKVQSNRERTIKDALRRRIAQEGLEEFFGDIVIPVEKIVDNKTGKRRVIEQKLYPGYLMVQMVLNDDTWYLVRTTNGVGDFTGSAGQPIPMEPAEISRLIGAGTAAPVEQPKIKLAFNVDDGVKIKEGPFVGFDGQISSVDENSGKITVLIQILGRPTPVDLDSWQVERI